ncbi:MAG TPA: ATP-binding protein [Gemmatimonadaceae bacterium]|nr:ATP-binding protein [Gemmatimonadaceae bacterium]
MPLHSFNDRRTLAALPTAADVAGSESLHAAARLEDAFEAMPMAVALFDERLVLLRANAAFHALTGETATTRTGMATLASLFPAWPADGVVPFDGEPQKVRFVVRVGSDGADALELVEATLTPLPPREGHPRAVCFAGRVMTAAEAAVDAPERVDQLVSERTHELLHQQDVRARERRLAAVGQLAAGVMHDVNNALNPIVAGAHLIALNAESPAAVRDYAARIARAAETGVATAARVGRFIRQEPTSEAPNAALIDLSLAADEVIAITRPTWTSRALGGTVDLRRSLADGAMARGIACEVNEALLNLVQNALDAMAPAGGGVLGVTTRVAGLEAIVEVSDTGAGMTPEVCERAFEPFFTTKGARGTGLGLSEVYGIMKRHRGRAEIESQPGVGTTVRLVFPLATALTPSGEMHAFLDRVPKRVLVVDSDRATRDFISAVLVVDGHVVDGASSIADGLARMDGAAARHGRYDLLIVAPELSDGRCDVVVDAARSRWADVRVGVVAPPRVGPPTPPPRGEAAAAAGRRWGRRWYESLADFSFTTPVRPEELLALAAAEA